MPKETLSKRGARSIKLTVLIPAEVKKDLDALRIATCQSTADLVNQLLEQVVEAQADAVREGRRLLEREQERQEKAKRNALSVRVEREAPDPSKRSETLTPSPADTPSPTPAPVERERSESQHETAQPMFTENDIVAWSMESENVTTQRKRRSEGRKFLEWLKSEGRAGTIQDAEDYVPLVRARYSNEATARNIVAVPRGLVKWWAERSEGA